MVNGKESTQHQVNRVSYLQKEEANKISHLYSQMETMNRNLVRIYGIWDGFFKVLGTILSLLTVGSLIWVTRNLYYLNGKWNFVTVCIGAILFIAVLALMIALVWMIVNTLLVNKIESINRLP